MTVALALASTQSSDPWISVPLLFVSWVCGCFLAYHHEGRALLRLLFVVVASLVLSLIAYRNLRHIPTIGDISSFCYSRVVALTSGMAPNAPGTRPGLKAITGTGFWVDRNGTAITCREAVEVIKPPESPFVAPQVEAGIEKSGGIEVIHSGSALIFPVASAQADGPFAVLHVSYTDAEISLFGIPVRIDPFTLSTEMPKVGDHVFVVGVEAGRVPTFTPLDGTILRIASGPHFPVEAFSDMHSYRDTYCGAPVVAGVPIVGGAEDVIGMAVGETSSGELEIIPSPFIVEAINESKRR